MEEQDDITKLSIIKKIYTKYLCDGENAPIAIFAETILERDFKSQQELTQYLDCDKAHTSRTLLKMQKNGLIHPISKSITLTEKGKLFALDIQKKKAYLKKELFSGISENDIEVFVSVLEQMTNNAKRLIDK